MKKYNIMEKFEYTPILGGRTDGITRRDPSPVIKVNDTFFVWYTRTTETFDGYTGSIWYATSKDGIKWEEQKEAISKGYKGSFDEQAVFTPSILISNGKYYMSYTAVPKPFINKGANITKTVIGMAIAQSPHGPWEKLCQPILRTSNDPNEFDSLRIDDTCFIHREDKYYMYYKGRQIDHTPKETKMGVAIANKPEGPYIRYDNNPVLDSGHEVCVWPNSGGVYSLVCDVGPQGNTLQFSQDGYNFKKIGSIIPPKAPGPYREDHFSSGKETNGKWGISMSGEDGWPYLFRYEAK
jgi:beta-xylosidase